MINNDLVAIMNDSTDKKRSERNKKRLDREKVLEERLDTAES